MYHIVRHPWRERGVKLWRGTEMIVERGSGAWPRVDDIELDRVVHANGLQKTGGVLPIDTKVMQVVVADIVV